MMKDPLTEEEENYRLSLGEDRLQKRPDILLFPKEGKCIIIEFKNPVENVSDRLSQINKYAWWLRNLTKEKFAIDTFCGYLIGQNIEVRDVMAAEIASNGVRGNRSKEGARISAPDIAQSHWLAMLRAAIPPMPSATNRP